MEMDRGELRAAIKNDKIQWQKHALERMMERGISRDAVKDVLLSGELIENYPDDRPYPSALFYGLLKGDPFHVVAALDQNSGYCFIITTYRPDTEHFEPDFKTRR